MTTRNTSLVADAAAQGIGIGAFNVTQLEHAEAFAIAAQAADAPIMMQISENAVKYHGGLAPIARATLAVIEASPARLGMHLDHAEDVDLVFAALDEGFTSVMYDGSALDYAENVATTVNVVARAHQYGAVVEAELGKVGGKDGVHAPGVRTDPAEAATFVADTGVDSLAVAVGSSHAMTERSASLDFTRIAELHAAVPVPLVLHGSSGVSDADIQRAVHAGMTKINISTHLNKVQTRAIADFLEINAHVVDPRKYLGQGREAVAREVERIVRYLKELPEVTSR